MEKTVAYNIVAVAGELRISLYECGQRGSEDKEGSRVVQTRNARWR